MPRAENRTPAERYWARTVVSYGCWGWTGLITPRGYPIFWVDHHKGIYGHRMAYELHFGPIPAGMHTHHTCENKACVNPWHLEILTPQEHKDRHPQPIPPKPTHCKRGHPLSGDNLYSSGACATCKRMRELRYYHARKARQKRLSPP